MQPGLIITVSALLTCFCYNELTMTGLNGKWVDMSTKTDTLTFGPFGRQDLMILGRGTELRNGSLLPKRGSGLYEYKLVTDDKISLRWGFSSDSNFYDYYFKQTEDKIIIQNFFDPAASKAMLTFKRIN